MSINTRQGSRSRFNLGWTLALVILGGSTAVPASGAAFEPVAVWSLELSGEAVDGAQVYYSRAAGSFLVVADDLPSPVLLSARTRTVSPVQSLKLQPTDSGGFEMLPGAIQESTGSFQMQQGVVHFEVGGQSATLEQRSWLTGWQSRQELIVQNIQYREDAEEYEPDQEVIQSLRNLGEEVRLVVYFGEWCPHCAKVMPKLLAVEAVLADTAITFRHYGLPTRMGDDPVVEKLDIKGVPTGIVYRDGEEIGRLYGQPFEEPGQALLDVLVSS